MEPTGSLAIGTLTGPQPRTSVEVVIDFVTHVLDEFCQDPENRRIRAEKSLNGRLVGHLNLVATRRSSLFMFGQDEPELPDKGDSPSVDVAAHSTMNMISVNSFQGRVIVLLEAKLLTTHSESRRRQEYLVGHEKQGKYRYVGGVERFKTGIHGRKFTTCAMIGYVFEESFEYWHGTINAWIGQFEASGRDGWSSAEKLVVNVINKRTARLRSAHPRGSETIALHHVWVDFTS